MGGCWVPGPSACSAVGAHMGTQPAGWAMLQHRVHGGCWGPTSRGQLQVGVSSLWERTPVGVSPCRQPLCSGSSHRDPVASGPLGAGLPRMLEAEKQHLKDLDLEQGKQRGEQQNARTPGVISAWPLGLLGHQPVSPTASRGQSRTLSPSPPPDPPTASSGLGKPGSEGSPARLRGLSCTAIQPSVKWAEKKRDGVMFLGPGAEDVCPPWWPRSPPRLQSGAGCSRRASPAFPSLFAFTASQPFQGTRPHPDLHCWPCRSRVPPGTVVPSAALGAVTLAGCRMRTLAWLGIASLCLGAAWAVPAKEKRKAGNPKADLALYENLDLDNYDLTLDNYGEILDLNNYEELYDYGDLAPKVRGTQESTQCVGQVFPGCIPRKGLVPRNGWGIAGEPASCTSLQAWVALPPFLLMAGKALPDPDLHWLPCPLPSPGQSITAGCQDMRLPASLGK